MDPHHPRREDDASSLVDDMATAPHDGENPGPMVTQRRRPVAIASRTALSGVAKDAISGTPHEFSIPEDSMIRESWVSFASTAASRDSAAPSIFSVRASTASASTRYSVRQSSIESPISATSPMYHEHRKSSFPRNPRYHCTFCDVVFDTKTEWKLHELEFHDRREQYVCSSCPAVFPRATLLTEHLKDDHGLDSAPDTPDPFQYSTIRSAWGCGFCAAVVLSRSDYLEHVGEHYDEGREHSEWQHTRVIEALLHQPKVSSAWLALVNKEEHARGAKLRFQWDPNTSGRSSDTREPHLLQDMLEFFATGIKNADEVATVAYSTAQIRIEGNVSDLIRKLYLRNPEPKSAKPAPDPARLSPELQPAAQREVEDLVSPMSPLPPPLRLPAAPSRPLHPSTSAPDLESLAIHAPANPFAVSGKILTLFRESTPQPPRLSSSPPAFTTQMVPTTSPPHPFKPTGLRRIDSSRTLALSTDTGPTKSLGRQVIRSLPQTADAPPNPIRRTAEPHSRLLGTRVDSSSAGDRMKALSPLKVNTASSVRPHASSSTLSTHTGDGSQGFGDSTSEVMSDDSVSEPDSWLEVDGIPRATKVWKSSFQQHVDQGMERLWARYNRDWESLVTQCVGDRNSDSAQFRESSGRVRKGASSRHAPSKGLRPSGRSLGQEDEEDDDEAEGYRPPSSMSKRSSDSAKRFACPFRKHDPHTYNIHDHEVCAIRSWLTISRLKEHLYRRHYTTHCQRCKQTFSDARELAEHEMSVVGCEVLDIIPPGDITTYQEKQLKSRKHTTRRQSDKEKWDDIYRLLFPNEEIPSPYPEVAEDVKPLSSESHTSFNFQHFLLTEMPSLFTQTAEEHAGRHLRPNDGLPMEAIPRIIEEALQKAFRTWEARGSELPTREASVASMSFLPETPTSLSYTFAQPTTYQTPQPVAAMDHTFSQSHFGNAGFVPEVPHVSHADDSGFADGNFFTSGPPVNFNTFAPQYERGTWENDLDLMGAGAFEPGLGIDGHFHGFRHR